MNTSNIRAVKQFLKFLKPNKKAIYQIYFFAVFSGILSLSLPLGIQAIINFLQFGQFSTSWILLVSFVIIGIAVNGILYVIQLSISESIQENIFTRASFDFAYRLPKIKEDTLQSFYGPEIVNRFFDVLTIQKGLPKLLLDITTAIMQIFFGLILLSLYHSFFIFFALLLLVLIILLIWLMYSPAIKSSLSESKYKYKVVYWLQEIARARSTFKLAGFTQLPLQKNDKLVSKYLHYRSKHFSILKIIYGCMIVFKIIIALGLLLIGGMLVIKQEMNIGQFVAAEIIILLIINSVEKLISTTDVIFDVITASEKLHFITSFPLEKEDGVQFTQIDTKQGIEVQLSNVSIKLDLNNAFIKDVSLHLHPGEKICITGYERSGKSTLLKVIAGLFDHYKGSVTYNNIPLQNINLTSLRSYIGDSLSQEDIFEGTLMENISLGRPNVGIQEVKWACEQVGLALFVEQMPKGYDTQIEASGLLLSKSTKRKIILARSIADKPRLLLLDSQTLDGLNEQQIQAFLNNKHYLFSIVLVTNSKKIAQQCDRIIVLKEGQIIESEKSIEKLKTLNDVLK